ncbi:MAG: metallophosphoesterase [Thermoplasmata archaeon]
MSTTRALLSPSEILRLPASGADDLLDHLERHVPTRPPLVEIPGGTAEEAVVFGDSHGDWRSVEEVVNRFREGNRCLVGLGDYVDRAPDDCGAGSVANALYLLGLAAEAPERVYLIQGNHEMVRRIPVRPHHLPLELATLWGPDRARYDRILGLLERGPCAAFTSNGAYLAHAGFPRGRPPTPWSAAFAHPDEECLAELAWAECDASGVRRGAALPWGRHDLEQFLGASGLRLFLRGHDPDLTGRALFGGECLTLHTCRVYERYGGVIVARLPLRSPVRTLVDVRLEHLSTEGRTFDPPG